MIKNPKIEKIIVGKICSTYGILGWLKMISFTERKLNIFNYQPWLISQNNNWKTIVLENWKNYKKNKFIIKLKNIKSIDEAILLKGKSVFIKENQLPALSEDEYYWKDILKCYVKNINGDFIGKVVELIEGVNTNNVLVVENNLQFFSNRKKELIPFLYGKIIKNVDIKNKIIEVNWDLN